MAEAGYNPIEMARFFEKLQSEGGPRGPQFLSDHPNPGNRVKAVEDEIRQFPQKNNPEPIQTMACTLFGLLYVPWLLSFIALINFSLLAESSTARMVLLIIVSPFQPGC